MVYTGPGRVDQHQILVSALPEDPKTALDVLLTTLVKERGSDLHIQAGEPPRFRKDGELLVLRERDTTAAVPPFSRNTVVRMVESLLTGDEALRFERANALAQHHLERSAASAQALRLVLERHRTEGRSFQDDVAGFDADTSYELVGNTGAGVARFRVNISLERGQPRIVMRQIPTHIQSMRDLELPEALYRIPSLRRGLVLVTGPTGSGKSTTLAAIIDQINHTRACSVLTIEDPIEFVHRSDVAMISQREIGEDTPTFSEGLRRALRQDPDVIMVGEMRDLETMRIALEAAETGHLVLGTLHTKSAKDTLTRIVNQYPADEQEQVRQTLAGSLQAVVGQVLLPRIGGGRVAALEIMFVTDAIRAQMLNPSGFSQIDDSIRGSQDIGNRLLDDHLFDLASNRRITPEDAVLAAMHRPMLSDRLARAGLAPKF